MHSLLSSMSTMVPSIPAIFAPSHGISYCYDIPQYIVTLTIMVNIDDKYWRIADIAQHYCRPDVSRPTALAASVTPYLRKHLERSMAVTGCKESCITTSSGGFCLAKHTTRHEPWCPDPTGYRRQCTGSFLCEVSAASDAPYSLVNFCSFCGLSVVVSGKTANCWSEPINKFFQIAELNLSPCIKYIFLTETQHSNHSDYVTFYKMVTIKRW